MVHPLLRLAATRPQLLADHVEAYAALVTEDMGAAVSIWKRRVLLSAIALALLAVGATLGGVAVMLWSVVPAPNSRAAWALVIVPAVPLVVSMICLLACRRKMPRTFADVKQQLAADCTMLREANPPERASS